MKKAILAGMIALALVYGGVGVFAQQQPAPPPANSPQGLLTKFGGLMLSDLQAAEAIAKAAGDDIADKCYLALIGLVQQMQTVSGQASSASNSIVNLQAFTAFEKARLILNAQRSTSPVFQACAPLKAQIKQDALTAPGALLSLF